jgi:hypothetical protein
MFADSDGEKPREPCGGDRVDHQGSSRLEDPAQFTHDAPQIGNMLQALTRHDDIGRGVREGQSSCVPLNHSEPMLTGNANRRRGQVHTDVHVAQVTDVRGQ